MNAALGRRMLHTNQMQRGTRGHLNCESFHRAHPSVLLAACHMNLRLHGHSWSSVDSGTTCDVLRRPASSSHATPCADSTSQRAVSRSAPSVGHSHRHEGFGCIRAVDGRLRVWQLAVDRLISVDVHSGTDHTHSHSKKRRVQVRCTRSLLLPHSNSPIDASYCSVWIANCECGVVRRSSRQSDITASLQSC
jgi:hypothetical protein